MLGNGREEKGNLKRETNKILGKLVAKEPTKCRKSSDILDLRFSCQKATLLAKGCERGEMQEKGP